MTTPNLDALAKLAPFRADGHFDDDFVVDRNEHTVMAESIAAALNEWVELRAYRERTEAALVDHCAGVRGLLNDLGRANEEASDGK